MFGIGMVVAGVGLMLWGKGYRIGIVMAVSGTLAALYQVLVYVSS